MVKKEAQIEEISQPETFSLLLKRSTAKRQSSETAKHLQQNSENSTSRV